ncbi:MAG: CPBP family intramembrane metalloprotease [Lachnospiraceae bacterium]|jgi:membrane protease YdiL (CAAX protease family)|nr:CPBP family intramembrane metalloprotease [Lachnospiraceae bacterium]
MSTDNQQQEIWKKFNKQPGAAGAPRLTHEEEKKLNLRQIVIYLALTFLLTYSTEIFGIMPMVGSADPEQALAAQQMISSVMFIPAIGALLTRLLTKERLTAKSLMLTVELKKDLKYYGIAWFGFVLLTLFGAALYFLIFPGQFDPELGYMKAISQAQGLETTKTQLQQAVVMQLVMGVILAPFVNLINCFGEEWGWRGFLLPRMLKQFKVVPALLLSGLIWGLWHAPLTVMGHNYGVGYPGYPFMGIFAMCLFCIAMGIILSYVTIKTKSCIPAIMGHGTLNGFASAGLMFTSLDHPYNVFLGPAPTGLIGGAGFIIVAGFLLYRLYKEENEGKEFTF